MIYDSAVTRTPQYNVWYIIVYSEKNATVQRMIYDSAVTGTPQYNVWYMIVQWLECHSIIFIPNGGCYKSHSLENIY